jgi:hypothetical protein
MASHRLRRAAGGHTFASSVYLYSQHQLIGLSVVKDALPSIRWERRGDHVTARFQVAKVWKDSWLGSSRAFRDVAISASALEAPYWVDVLGVVRFRELDEVDGFEEWRRKRPIKQALRWLGVNPDRLADTAAALLHRADRIDPLGRWYELLAHANPEGWQDLRGDARLAVDFRVTAELMLRYYEDLAEARQARRLERSRSRERGRFDHRLKRSRSVDQVLTDLGLSPHPRLVLVVEGETEMLLVPRVLSQLVVNTDEDVISVQNATGVGTDLGPLMAFLAPRVVKDEHDDRHLNLARPATRILVVFDPERPVADEEAREHRRQTWVDRVLRAMPREHQTAAVREQIDLLVKVTTWNRRKESFEFAHFTDRQLARAITQLPSRRRRPTMDQMTGHVAATRKRRGNLEDLIPGGSKTDLADLLWPVLERRITQGIARETESRIPIVRILDEAVALAYEFPRQGLVIRLRPSIGSAQSD